MALVKKRVLVTGSRDWTDYHTIAAILEEEAPTEIAHGGCPRGADKMADEWASRSRIPARAYDANWAKYPKIAGFIRNQEMLDAFQPHLVIAFKDGLDPTLREGGTEHMVKIAREAGYEVRIIDRYQALGLFADD